MKISDVFSSGYLKASDIPEGKTVAVEIEQVELTSFSDDGSNAKPTVSFKGTNKRLVLNRTNSEILVHMMGDDTDAWTGRKIILRTEPVLFQGKMVQGIKVAVTSAAPLPPAAAPQPQPAAPANALELPGDEVPF